MRIITSFCLLFLTILSVSAQKLGCIDGDCEDGKGTYVYQGGSKYEGKWKNGMKHGKGTLYYDSGAIYEGQFENDNKHGRGVYTSPDGSSYDGEFVNNRMTGKGTKTYRNGDIYKGDFLDGKRHGLGEYAWKNGSKYSGDWFRDQRTGTGTFTSANGKEMSGKWQAGRLIKSDAPPSKQVASSSDTDQTATNQSRIPLPAKLSWITPEALSMETQASKIALSLCVETQSKLESVDFFVNGELQMDQATRGYTIVPSEVCNLNLKRTVSLHSGRNVIEVVVKNEGGESRSTERIINANLVTRPKIVEKRNALVIGNGNYSNGPLRNPANDAKSMASELEQLEFDVMLHTDISQAEMKKAIRDFGEKVREEGGIGLFYFAGHGMQVNGHNYLIPVGAEIQRELDVELESVELYRVLGEMEEADNRMNIVILDACRNNPYTRQFRSNTGEGLTLTTAPSGTFIAFATAPGSVAADGSGKNGLYTQELLGALRVPGLKIEDVFKRVRTQVRTKSKGAQIPWENSSIEGDFYFHN